MEQGLELELELEPLCTTLGHCLVVPRLAAVATPPGLRLVVVQLRHPWHRHPPQALCGVQSCPLLRQQPQHNTVLCLRTLHSMLLAITAGRITTLPLVEAQLA